MFLSLRRASKNGRKDARGALELSTIAFAAGGPKNTSLGAGRGDDAVAAQQTTFIDDVTGWSQAAELGSEDYRDDDSDDENFKTPSSNDWIEEFRMKYYDLQDELALP
jgi:hypothetical protein